jgi:hypothetical protein
MTLERAIAAMTVTGEAERANRRTSESSSG